MPGTIRLIVAGLIVGRSGPTRDALSYVSTPQSQGVIWQGFSQTWGYNHRLNSLGDWVGPLECSDRCQVVMGHSAASGSGADTAHWSSQSTAVSAAGVRFRQGVIAFDIDERRAEGRIIRAEASIEFVDIEDHTTTTALLGGLDIFAIDNADKLQELSLSLSAPELTDTGTLRVTASLDLRVDCDSIECDGLLYRKFNHEVRYRVEVPVLLLTADEGAMVVSNTTLDAAYAWGDHRTESAPMDRDAARMSASMADNVVAQTVGLTGLSVQLNQDYHFSGWSSRIELVDRMLHGEMLFQQWNRGSVESPLAKVNEIEAQVELSAAVLGFSDACTEAVRSDGEQHWKANGGSARSAEATTQTTHEILATCPMRPVVYDTSHTP